MFFVGKKIHALLDTSDAASVNNSEDMRKRKANAVQENERNPS